MTCHYILQLWFLSFVFLSSFCLSSFFPRLFSAVGRRLDVYHTQCGISANLECMSTWGNGRGCPLVVHYWSDLQSVHGFRCYDSIHVCKFISLYTVNAHSAEREMLASACTRSMAGYVQQNRK